VKNVHELQIYDKYQITKNNKSFKCILIEIARNPISGQYYAFFVKTPCGEQHDCVCGGPVNQDWMESFHPTLAYNFEDYPCSFDMCSSTELSIDKNGKISDKYTII
jgi:hypothetical protein